MLIKMILTIFRLHTCNCMDNVPKAVWVKLLFWKYNRFVFIAKSLGDLMKVVIFQIMEMLKIKYLLFNL